MRKLTYIGQLSWDKIEWSTHYKEIRRIQRRIYNASTLNDKEK